MIDNAGDVSPNPESALDDDQNAARLDFLRATALRPLIKAIAEMVIDKLHGPELEQFRTERSGSAAAIGNGTDLPSARATAEAGKPVPGTSGPRK